MPMQAGGRGILTNLLRIALLTLAYAATGVPALLLSIPPGYAAAIFPPAGIMLAAGAIYGYRVLPAAFLGSLLMRLIAFGIPAGPNAMLVQAVTLVIAAAAALQAALGTRLVRGMCGDSPALDTPPTIVRFVVLCPLSALVSSTISTMALVESGLAAPGSAFFFWWNWWMGDTLGMLVAVPVMFALFGKPREHWSPRRWTVALPLLGMIGLGALVSGVIAGWEGRRVTERFQFDAQRLAYAFLSELRLDVLAVEAAARSDAGLGKAGPQPAWISETPTIRSVGRVSAATLKPVSRPGDVAILSTPSARVALQRALSTQQISASDPWTTGHGAGEQSEFLVWIPLPPSPAGTPAAARDLAYAIINVNRLDPRLLVSVAGGLAICWVDRTAAGASHRIAGPPGCESPARDRSLAYEVQAPLWGHDWLIRVAATPHYVGALRSWGAWAFSALIVLAIGATGIFLLLLTAHARAVEQLAALRGRELEREKEAAREAEGARLRAEETARAKGRFLSNASHELRTPLNGVLGIAQVLLRDTEEKLSSRQRKWVEWIESAGRHLEALIDDVLDLSRIDAGAMKLAPVRVALDGAVDDVTNLLSSEAAGQDVMIQVDRDSLRGVELMADATRLKQVLTNLVGNAIKYNRRGGSMAIRARRDGDGHVLITVADTGPGMSAAQLADLFQPFNRLGRDAGPVKGTGLGLVVTRNLVELMQGTIQVDSVEGRGSEFSVRLPAAAPGVSPERLSEASQATG